LEWDKTACRFVFSYWTWTWTWTCLFWRELGLGLGLGCCWTCYKSDASTVLLSQYPHHSEALTSPVR